MSNRPVLEPTAAHPITVTPTVGRVTVRINGELVADSRAALTLQESTYPAVHYIPITDVDEKLLVRTDAATHCPYKGDASYYSIATAAGDTVDEVIWTYEQPYPAVAAIAGHLAFYPDRAEIAVS